MSLSLDLDNKWCYLQTNGDDAWQEFPSYLPYLIPRVLEFLGRHQLRITFFVVGQDAAMEENQSVLRMLADAGHEIGCHSHSHEPWLHLYSDEQLNAELAKAEAAIKKATGIRVRGFRGPGYSLSEGVLRVLIQRGYQFDASAFPNLLSPLARAYFFARSKLDEREKKRRSALFGSFADVRRPVKPYRWQVQGEQLLELPVTTLPGLKLPIHFSYLIYLASFSEWLARAYLGLAIVCCRVTRTEPSMLMHPLDFMGAEDDEELSFFPAMSMSLARKLNLMDTFVSMLCKRFKPLTMGEHVARIDARASLAVFEPDFDHPTLESVMEDSA